MSAAKTYRPSNGTEGDIFMGQWCAFCRFNDMGGDGDPCDIQTFAICHDIGNDDYPSEWIIKDGKPKCTAFEPALDETGEPVTPRCDKTPDMFERAK